MRSKRTRVASGQVQPSPMGQQLEFSWQWPDRSESGSPVLESQAFVGRARVVQTLWQQVQQAASSPMTTVLLSGESGTGKELVARAVHFLSPRSNGPFVAFNCAAVAGGLEDSELFGHARGAFSGAVQVHKGFFEAARGGTIFLDEVGEASLSLQAKLLRVIQERQVRRVGESTSHSVDVRIVAATNRNLLDEVERGQFRRDLFFRLAVLCIHLPPLRERREDIEALASHFLARVCRCSGRSMSLSADVLRLLESHSWPGNVRELENAVERAAVMAPPWKNQLEAEDFYLLGTGTNDSTKSHSPIDVGEAVEEDEWWARETTLSVRSPVHSFERKSGVMTLEEAVCATEKEVITQAIARCGGDSQRMAQELGVSQATLWRKMKRYGLR